MKYIKYVFIVTLLLSCEQKIYPTTSVLTETNSNTKCKELVDFIENNMFYVKKDNSYLLSYAFTSVIQRNYTECMSNLSFEEMINLFGKPSCKTDDCACYYLYHYLPIGTTYEKLTLNPNGFAFAFKKDGNKTKRVDKCNCEK